MARAQREDARRGAPGLRRRAQDRRALDLVALRGRRPRARGDARRRAARRGRHGKRADDPHGAAADPGDVAARGARRGLLLEGGLREGQRRSGGGRRAPLRQPAQRGRGDDAPARLPRHGAEAPRRLALFDGRGRAGAGQPERGPRAPRLSGLPGEPAPAPLRDVRGSSGVRRGVEGQTPRARIRNRRRGHQGGRPGDAAGARRDRQIPALGARLQVPRRRGHDRGARDRHERRPHRHAHARRVLRPGAARRNDGQARDASQLRGPGAKRRPRRRHRHRGEGGRRHPQGRAGGARATAFGRAAVRHAEPLPGLRRSRRPRARRGRAPLRESGVPGRRAGGHPPFLRPQSHEHRGPRREARRSARDRGPALRRGLDLRPRRRRIWSSSNAGARSRRPTSSPRSRRARRTSSIASSSRSASATSGRKRRRSWPDTSAPSTP